MNLANPSKRNRMWKKFFYSLAANGAVSKVQAQAAADILNETGWRDIRGQINTRIGPTNPTSTQIGTSGIYMYAFAINDEADIGFHIPHDYVEGTDILFHVHWMPSGTDTNSVKWEVSYMYAKGHNQANFDPSSLTVVTAEESPPGTAYRHMVTETAAVPIAGLEADGIIEVAVKRITNGGSENLDTIFVMECDVHYQSTNEATPNREPDFY